MFMFFGAALINNRSVDLPFTFIKLNVHQPEIFYFNVSCVSVEIKIEIFLYTIFGTLGIRSIVSAHVEKTELKNTKLG